MKIIYKQRADIQPSSSFRRLGIKNCYLKELDSEKDVEKIIAKPHHHTMYEIHMVFRGKQVYEIGGKQYKVHENEFIIISPLCKHQSIDLSDRTLKYSFTFSVDKTVEGGWIEGFDAAFYFGSLPNAVMENIAYIVAEKEKQKLFSSLLIENRALESILLLFRASGLHESPAEKAVSDQDDRLAVAKQYINDNIELKLSVADIAAYCHLSQKQITRLFLKYDGISPSQYINKNRIAAIEKLIVENELTLKEISEKMNFNNEYYFNTYFKKYCGMSPGAYKKMHAQK